MAETGNDLDSRASSGMKPSVSEQRSARDPSSVHASTSLEVQNGHVEDAGDADAEG